MHPLSCSVSPRSPLPVSHPSPPRSPRFGRAALLSVALCSETMKRILFFCPLFWFAHNFRVPSCASLRKGKTKTPIARKRPLALHTPLLPPCPSCPIRLFPPLHSLSLSPPQFLFWLTYLFFNLPSKVKNTTWHGRPHRRQRRRSRQRCHAPRRPPPGRGTGR